MDELTEFSAVFPSADWVVPLLDENGKPFSGVEPTALVSTPYSDEDHLLDELLRKAWEEAIEAAQKETPSE